MKYKKYLAVIVTAVFVGTGLSACTASPSVQTPNPTAASSGADAATPGADATTPNGEGLRPMVDSNTKVAVYRAFWGDEVPFETVLKKDANGCLVSDAKKPQLLIVPEGASLTSSGVVMKFEEYKFGEKAKFRTTGSSGYGGYPVAIPEGCDYPEDQTILINT